MTATTDTDFLRLTGTVIRLVRQLDHAMATAVGADVGLTEMMVLGSIDRGIGLGSQVSRNLQLDPPRVTRIVDRLVSLGYITRGTDTSDRRRSPLTITRSGAAILTSARQALSDGMESMLSQLPEGSREAFVEALDRLRLHLEA